MHRAIRVGVNPAGGTSLSAVVAGLDIRPKNAAHAPSHRNMQNHMQSAWLRLEFSRK